MNKAIAVLALPLMVGCGGSQAVPGGDYSQANASVRAAEEVGAQSEPQAALHLKMAKDQIATAKNLMREDEPEEAALVLERARLDAELAIALTRQAKLRAQAEEARQRISSLENQQNAGE